MSNARRNDMTSPILRNELTAEHALDLLRREKTVLKRLREVYEEARLVILGRLTDVSAETFTAQHLRSVEAQIDAGLWAMIQRFQGEAKGITQEALEAGVEQTLAEIEFWDARFRGGATTRIAVDVLVRVTEPGNLVLEKFEASLNAYGQSLIADTRRRLGVHLAMQSNWSEMTNDIAGRLRENMISGARWRAERIVRTEMVDALNAGHQAALEEAAEIILGLKRQWDSTLDERTSDGCRYLHGRVVGIHEPWHWEGQEVARPPLWPNCRSIVLAFHDDWVGDDEE
jgi:SPP1 gp7 family putative phage head morphogenesis protein